MRVAIHQPHYFPYAGFFHKMGLVDAFVVMDETQYDRRFTNRNRILDTHGTVWLSVPIDKSDKFLRNRDVRINEKLPWRSEHWRKIEVSYANSPYFHLYSDELKEFYETVWSSLLDLDVETMRKVMEWLDIDVPVVMESSLGVDSTGTRRLVDICGALGADTYVSGRGGRAYLAEELFVEKGVRLEYQQYAAVPYPQKFASSFVPDLSILDVLFSCGAGARELVGLRAPVPA